MPTKVPKWSEIMEAMRNRERRTGVIGCYDPINGRGFIEMDGGGSALLTRVCLAASGLKTATLGERVTFDAVPRPQGWTAVAISKSPSSNAPQKCAALAAVS